MADHPLAPESLPTLKALQTEGQQVDARGYHMQLSEFVHWGFVIYRCDYTDDELWARFIARRRHEVDGHLVNAPAEHPPSADLHLLQKMSTAKETRVRT
jgi:hypothetical protein